MNNIQSISCISLISNRFETSFKIANEIDVISDLMYDDVRRVLSRSKFIVQDYDTAYFTAVRILKNTIKKLHLKGVQRFYELQPEKALRWILARLVNSIKNVTTNPKDPEFIGQRVEFSDQCGIVFPSDIYQYELERDVEKLPFDLLLEGLHKLWIELLDDNQEEFDVVDFIDLCQRFNIDPILIIGSESASSIQVMINSSSQKQLFFDFSKESVA